MTFLLFLRQGFSFLGSCCYLISQRTQLVFTGERLYHTSSPRWFLCDTKETRRKLPWWSLWASMDSTRIGPTNCASHKSSDPIKGPRAPVLNKTHKHLHSHTQTQLECQINPVRCHLSEYNKQYQSKAVIACRHCIHTLKDSNCEQVLPAVYSNNQIASTPRSSTKEVDNKHTAPCLSNN